MALVEGVALARDGRKEAEIVIGEDWDGEPGKVEPALHEGRSTRGVIRLHSSPIARKIVIFNLLALVVLLAGILFINPFRDSLVAQREAALRDEARLVADVFEAHLGATDPAVSDLGAVDALDIAALSQALQDDSRAEIRIYDAQANRVGGAQEAQIGAQGDLAPGPGVLDRVVNLFDRIVGSRAEIAPASGADVAAAVSEIVSGATKGQVHATVVQGAAGTSFLVAAPVETGGAVAGAVLVSSADGELDALVAQERQKILQLFLVAVVVSVGLSLLLASTIANPLSDLALAAEIGRDRNARKMSPSRVRIPDLTARPDEIGRLSGAMRGMVRALYDRIDANEQFAADVSHEIKNPLASLRSAVGTLRIAKTDEQRNKLLDVIDHDVRRLDRLVSDISNASRLDSELVKEEEERFDLLKMLGHLIEFHGVEAAEKGVDFISDIPGEPIHVHGLEGRLAQVFVNLITNALSFCEDGDAVRVWVRQRDNRVLVVVEDTGPGIPDQALHKVFNRFYSERPERQFGNHSGLGLAISKQIIEAHGGVIWAENIRPTDADVTSDPLGARFVVGLPV